jgi:predicted nucleic acid-binding protein
VVDASALVLAVSGKSDAAAALRTRMATGRRHAPHLIDAAVGNVLRRHEQQALLAPDEAIQAFRTAQALVDHRYPHDGALAELAWAWRRNLKFYDALYVAVAALVQLPLVTADARLSRAPDLPCEIELV